jgi:hypothetical protein
MVYLKGDKVKIINSLDTWTGKIGIITSVNRSDNSPISYKLDIGGGDWSHHMLEKIGGTTVIERQEILGLALQEAFLKRDEMQQKINDLQLKKEGYQTMIDNIRVWQDELK